MLLLESIKSRLGLKDHEKDFVLQDLIDDTVEEVLGFLNMTTIPKGVIGTVKEIVVIKFNRLGSEGIMSESYDNINQSYDNKQITRLLKSLKRYRNLPR